MISEYLVAVWSHSPRWGNSSVKYYECGTHDKAQTFAKREAEYLDTIGREYDIDIYVNESLLEVNDEKLELTKEDLEDIRAYIVNNIMRNPDVMFADYRINQVETGDVDLVKVIASLYELLHQMVTGESYRYMFHWANKCGAWVEDNVFDAYTLEGKGML